MPGLTGLSGLSGLSALTGGTLLDRILSTNPLAHWPMDELVGINSDELINGALWDGTYTGVALNDPVGQPSPDGSPVGRWDGGGDYDDIYSVPLAAAFNGAEGSFLIYGRMFNLGVWTDGVHRRLVTLRADGANRVLISKQDPNDLRFNRIGGGINEQVQVASGNPTTFFSVGLTWSETADEVRAYVDGFQVGVTQVGLGAWVGALHVNTTLVGSSSKVPANVHNGWLSRPTIWDRALSPGEMQVVGIP